ncbi:MAG: glycogen/starch synthase [Muribaculaceae bacterium]|nr:glycogen/starch synthase [Muribaculaceae bacterium]
MDNCNVGFDLLIETSWEVCNKIGGIYTVLSTKAATLQKQHKDKTIFIGPDVWSAEHPSPYFVESRTLLKKWLAEAELPEGVDVRVGRWDIPGKPIVVLVKFDGMYKVKDEFYGRMWQLYGVDSLHAYGDYDEACAFSHAAGIVARSLAKFHIRHKLVAAPQAPRIISHCDEWTTGMALLYIKSTCPQVATVFTTHATSIGRSICGNGKPLYDQLHNYNGDQMAQELNMESKHSLEKAAATQADCFTTVSEVTARECEQLLGRRPDVVTPNGFESNFVPKGAKLTQARANARRKMLDIASALTGNDFSDDTFIIATSGRCEYRNKCLDLFLDAISRLGDRDPKRRILAFVMVPAWVDKARPDLAYEMAVGSRSRLSDPVITHTLHNYGDDAIINRIHQIGLTNNRDARASVIYVPCYLNGDDGIFDMTYYQLIAGFDAIVFPSYYEPWGYTPLESVAFGVPTVTTSLSGFGQWVLDTFEDSFAACGVRVENRTDSNYDAVCDHIADDLKTLVADSPTALTDISRAAKATAKAASWSNFIVYYDRAYCIAIEKAEARNK